ncbi:hypothetical protein BS50DRAFT_542415 [Corynespora cassiicola Philippines]|uniref:tRNA(Ile)-lysidine synthetase n=1 Tax=Corynespora cassiicola Philippines TaxID=1448308 RepID=A0A2T2P5S8_CORCC|nr:hypothetical protein BS50DRAFT_542415 [Corynespora cassiicola Philippines]
MALATMYSKAALDDPRMPPLHGFIVDHKVRPESSEEAEWVAEHLRSKLGIPSTVIPLTWPGQIDQSDNTRFEADARRLRYQALGLACREHNIKSLMIAHHLEDQAETIFMRLINFRFRTGLAGVRAVDWLPECYGIHGVNRSGDLSDEEANAQAPFAFERGGIRILRPLLPFTKDRLIATCKEHGTQWVEDKTNHIATFTVRNAIRHVAKNHKLPVALQTRSLVRLSQNMQDRVQQHIEQAERAFEKTLLKFDVQTGSLIMRLPPVSALSDKPIVTPSDATKARNTAVYLMERITQLVSPLERPALGQMSSTIDSTYPELARIEAGEDGTQPQSQPAQSKESSSVNVHDVWFIKWDSASPFEEPNSKSSGLRHVSKASANPHNEWLLCRLPRRASEETRQVGWVTIPPSTSTTATATTTQQWHLFDGRHWIRVHNHGPNPLVLRHLPLSTLISLRVSRPRATDLKEGKDTPFDDSTAYLKAAVSLVEPHQAASALMGLFEQDVATGEQRLVALPTLGASLEPPLGTCKWDVRYKAVDFGAGRAAQDVLSCSVTGEAMERRVWKMRRKWNFISQTAERARVGVKPGHRGGSRVYKPEREWKEGGGRKKQHQHQHQHQKKRDGQSKKFPLNNNNKDKEGFRYRDNGHGPST